MKSKILILFLILAAASFLRLWSLDKMPPGLYPDEAMNGNNALEAFETGDFKMFYPENNGREGLFINIQAISVAIFGNKPWALRLVSSVFGVLTVLGTYFLAIQLFALKQPQIQNSKFKIKNDNLKFKSLERNEVIALIASFFLAVSFWHINFSRIGFRAIMAPFFLVWGFYLLLKALNNFQSKLNSSIYKQKKDIENWKLKILFLLSGFVYGLGFHSYIAYRVTPVLIILIFAYFWFKNKKARGQVFVSALLFFAAALIAISPLVFYFYQNPQDFLGRTSQISVFSSENTVDDLFLNTVKTFGMFWYQGDYNSRHNLSGEPQLWWPIGILFGLGLLIFIFRILKFIFSGFKKLKDEILPDISLLFWLKIGLLPVVVSNEGIPHALRAIIVIPPVMIISAVGLERLYAFISNWFVKQAGNFPEISRKILRIKKEFSALVIIFCVILFVQAYAQYFWRYAARPEIQDAFSKKYADLGNYLNFLPQNLDKFVIINAGGTDVRGLPMPSQTVMFITETFLPQWQKEKNLRYILPQDLSEIHCENSCVIAMLENDSAMRVKLKEFIPALQSDSSGGVLVLKNF